MDCAINVLIPHETANSFIVLPHRLMGALDARQINLQLKYEGCAYMCADSLSHGCGGAAISFLMPCGEHWSGFPCAHSNSRAYLFGFTCNKDTLAEIIEGLKIVYNTSD